MKFYFKYNDQIDWNIKFPKNKYYYVKEKVVQFNNQES